MATPATKLKVLVTGSTGNIGTELIHLLSLDPAVDEIRAATRSPNQDRAQLLAAMAPDRVKLVAFDAGDQGSLENVLADVDVLCLITPLSDDPNGWQRVVLDAAGRVRRILKVSVDAASRGAKDGPGAFHWAGEEMLRAMDVERAILRPTIFMQHLIIVPGVHVPGDDTVYLPIGKGQIAMVDCRDIARALAAFTVCPASDLPTDPVPMTGPEALGGEALAARLSEAARRTIAWNQDPNAFAAHSRTTGSPEELQAVYQAGADGAFAKVVTRPYEQLTGRRATSFAKFAADHSALFQARS